MVVLYKDGVTKTHTVHSLVALAYKGPRPEGYHINHLDGDKTNNAPPNLQYCTGSENELHAHRIGLKNFARQYDCDKFSPEHVTDIRVRRANGHTLISIAKDYNCSISMVSAICANHVYKWVA